MSERIENVVTSGTFSLDGGTWEVDNNVWIIGNDESVVIIDPAHNVDKISATVDGRTVEKILLTHAHDDHIRSAKEAADRFNAPVYLNSADRVLWEMVYPDWEFDSDLADGDTITIGTTELTVLETPGHSPGSVCFYSQDLSWENSSGVVFSGDTLFSGGPGATGRSYSDFNTIIESIKNKLFTLPDSTAVLTGHGDSTGIGLEAPELDAWIARGH
ncbi:MULTISPECIES: MBL fold metallo-hydrolase [unclassified Rothia (in: high G+C Gram-positive bacteria)]|uniref:MBL fold metallo-hydrolase n=1 Tax=unclassified Rothia (in: high G+C Gram-positive bacteria) TaxID=2689056 RepID=UPI00195713AD|nr:MULTISPECIES: MBL fold metallo-hydrolase [unclassified Rothia (in: high G+C Gram-positive bacteria)]MBM7050966.1 MBL fold metallo-hydrolase [Rothia sp. ZJ1223]QRZ62303.1 MBL fold metallo-hydrolase [Rothia sp. ZJ932]